MGVDVGAKIHPQICHERISPGPAGFAAGGFSPHPHPNPRVPSLREREMDEEEGYRQGERLDKKKIDITAGA